MVDNKAVLAGGCFWGMQDLFRRLPGVVSTRVGYTGGDVPDATYRDHGTHAEAIEIVFDPQRIVYRRLLAFFFQIHDPTTRNRQGHDTGTQYRSIIFYHNEEQRKAAESSLRDADASGSWSGPIVTEIVPYTAFYPADERHQDYFRSHPEEAYCQVVIEPKVAKLRKVFQDKLKK